MGLSMTLPKDKNHIDAEFVDAYWAISALSYDMEAVSFTLTCYPSREAKQLAGTPVLEPSMGGYGMSQPTYHPELYSWSPIFIIAHVFPEGIPLGRDAQLKKIYTFIKDYTGLPFEDVFEEDQTEEEEPSEEPSVEPTEETTEETSDEPSEEVIPEETPSEEEPQNNEESEVMNTDSEDIAENEDHYIENDEVTEGQTEETAAEEEPQEEEEKIEEETENE